MRTFVTLFDCKDIFSLSREIDDVLDYANTTVEEKEILDVSHTLIGSAWPPSCSKLPRRSSFQ